MCHISLVTSESAVFKSAFCVTPIKRIVGSSIANKSALNPSELCAALILILGSNNLDGGQFGERPGQLISLVGSSHPKDAAIYPAKIYQSSQ